MTNKATVGRPWYEHVSQMMTALTTMRERGLREYKLGLDHFLVLEALATASCCSEADLVRTLGRNASFYSRAVDWLVGRGWLRKQLKPRRDIRFAVQITPKGRRVYEEIQVAFSDRLTEALAPAPKSRRKAIRDRLMDFQQLLHGQPLDSAAPSEQQDEEVNQLHLSDL